MSREFEPGDVAMVGGFGGVRAIWQGNQWATENARYLSDFQVVARPLVVIDPQDDEQVCRLVDALRANGWTTNDTGFSDTGAALRSLVTPPKPEEPTGLGAVVEVDYDGKHGKAVFTGAGWTFYGECLVDHSADWHDFAAVRVLSPGVQP